MSSAINSINQIVRRWKSLVGATVPIWVRQQLAQAVQMYVASLPEEAKDEMVGFLGLGRLISWRDLPREIIRDPRVAEAFIRSWGG